MNPYAPLPPPCRNHPTRESLVRCADCAMTLCDECYRFRVDGRPTCARCAYEWSTRAARRVSLAVAFLGVAAGAGVFAERRLGLWENSPGEFTSSAVAAVVIAVLIARSGRAAGVTVDNRDPEEPVPEALPSPTASVYRVGARRVLMAAAPRVSGRATALVMLACFAGAAVLLPASVRLPRWIETELVLSLWWLTVAGVLATLLYRGFRLRDDYVYFAPWNRPPVGDDKTTIPATHPPKRSWLGWADDPTGCSDLDGESFIAFLVLAIVLGAALGAAWILVELALPLVFCLMYGLLMRAIGRVANDRHGCEGSLGRALAWGAGWATIYVLPIAAVTWALHALRR